MGWKEVTIIGAHSDLTGWGQPKKEDQDSWRATAASRHESLIITPVFKPCQFKNSIEFKTFKHKTRKSWTEYSRTVFGAHAESRLTDSKTEPSCPSRPPAPERTNTNRSLNMQTEKDVKEPNSAPARGVLWERRISNRWNTEFAYSCSCTDKYIQHYVHYVLFS